MQAMWAFQPRAANQTPPRTQVNGAVTAAVTQINLTDSPFETECSARFVVDGAQSVAWAYGAQAGLTTGNGVFMLANSVEVFTIPAGITQISVIAAATGSTLRITVGDGV
jgi:hypothetical protein